MEFKLPGWFQDPFAPDDSNEASSLRELNNYLTTPLFSTPDFPDSPVVPGDLSASEAAQQQFTEDN